MLIIENTWEYVFCNYNKIRAFEALLKTNNFEAIDQKSVDLWIKYDHKFIESLKFFDSSRTI